MELPSKRWLLEIQTQDQLSNNEQIQEFKDIYSFSVQTQALIKDDNQNQSLTDLPLFVDSQTWKSIKVIDAFDYLPKTCNTILQIKANLTFSIVVNGFLFAQSEPNTLALEYFKNIIVKVLSIYNTTQSFFSKDELIGLINFTFSLVADISLLVAKNSASIGQNSILSFIVVLNNILKQRKELLHTISTTLFPSVLLLANSIAHFKFPSSNTDPSPLIILIETLLVGKYLVTDPHDPPQALKEDEKDDILKDFDQLELTPKDLFSLAKNLKNRGVADFLSTNLVLKLSHDISLDTLRDDLNVDLTVLGILILEKINKEYSESAPPQQLLQSFHNISEKVDYLQLLLEMSAYFDSNIIKLSTANHIIVNLFKYVASKIANSKNQKALSFSYFSKLISMSNCVKSLQPLHNCSDPEDFSEYIDEFSVKIECIDIFYQVIQTRPDISSFQSLFGTDTLTPSSEAETHSSDTLSSTEHENLEIDNFFSDQASISSFNALIFSLLHLVDAPNFWFYLKETESFDPEHYPFSKKKYQTYVEFCGPFWRVLSWCFNIENITLDSLRQDNIDTIVPEGVEKPIEVPPWLDSVLITCLMYQIQEFDFYNTTFLEYAGGILKDLNNASYSKELLKEIETREKKDFGLPVDVASFTSIVFSHRLKNLLAFIDRTKLDEVFKLRLSMNVCFRIDLSKLNLAQSKDAYTAKLITDTILDSINDHRPPIKMLALRIILDICKYTSNAKWLPKSIFEGMVRSLSFREAEVVQLALDASLGLILAQATPSSGASEIVLSTINLPIELMNTVVYEIDYLQKPGLLIIHLEFLLKLIPLLGIKILSYLQPLLCRIITFLDLSIFNLTIASLQVIQLLIVQAWPRIQPYAEMIFGGLAVVWINDVWTLGIKKDELTPKVKSNLDKIQTLLSKTLVALFAVIDDKTMKQLISATVGESNLEPLTNELKSLYLEKTGIEFEVES